MSRPGIEPMISRSPERTLYLLSYRGRCNGCEVRIGNFVTRVTVRHHEACRLMPNSYPEWQYFHFAAKHIMGSFSGILFPSRIVFKQEYEMMSSGKFKNVSYFSKVHAINIKSHKKLTRDQNF